MSEFTYKGICPECGCYTSFWGGCSTAICDGCDAEIEVDDIDQCAIIGML